MASRCIAMKISQDTVKNEDLTLMTPFWGNPCWNPCPAAHLLYALMQQGQKISLTIK